MFSAEWCAGSVAVAMELLHCGKYLNQDSRLHCSHEVIHFPSYWGGGGEKYIWTGWIQIQFLLFFNQI